MRQFYTFEYVTRPHEARTHKSILMVVLGVLNVSVIDLHLIAVCTVWWRKKKLDRREHGTGAFHFDKKANCFQFWV